MEGEKRRKGKEERRDVEWKAVSVVFNNAVTLVYIG